MKIEIANENIVDRWENFIDSNPRAIAWQSFKWLDILRKNYNIKFYPIVALSGSEITGILPLYYLKIPFSKPILSSVPFAVAGGIVSDDPESERLLLDKAIEISKSHEDSKIIFKQYKHKVIGQLSSDENFCNKELSLSPQTEKMWAEFAQSNKDNIKLGEKTDFKIEHPSNDISGFHNFLFYHHQRKGIPCTGKGWITDLVKSGMYSIALMKLNNKIVAATMVKEFKDTISFPFSCTCDPNSENFHLIYNLYWELIKSYANKGKNICHSGRLPKSGEADAFRQGWGGQMHNYYYQYYPATNLKTEFNVKRSSKREAFEKLWKIAPAPITKIIGPQIVKRFP
jgi:serine/alanine adding enzyme